jgi:hypothetical protein
MKSSLGRRRMAGEGIAGNARVFPGSSFLGLECQHIRQDFAVGCRVESEVIFGTQRTTWRRGMLMERKRAWAKLLLLGSLCCRLWYEREIS